MNNKRIVYVKRTDKYVKIDFSDLVINEPFILCEADGTPVGHYVAASRAYQGQHGASEIRVLEIDHVL